MSTTPNPAQVIIHTRRQRIFNRHRHKFDRHRAKGSAFATALDDLEKKLFDNEGDAGDGRE